MYAIKCLPENKEENKKLLIKLGAAYTLFCRKHLNNTGYTNVNKLLEFNEDTLLEYAVYLSIFSFAIFPFTPTTYLQWNIPLAVPRIILETDLIKTLDAFRRDFYLRVINGNSRRGNIDTYSPPKFTNTILVAPWEANETNVVIYDEIDNYGATFICPESFPLISIKK